MDCKLCKTEDLNEKEHENSIGDHRLARSKEQEVKTKLGRISRDNGPKMGEKSAYDEREKQIIDKRLSEFTERDKNKRSAKKPINGIQRERHPISIPRSRWDAESRLGVPPANVYLQNEENSYFSDSLWGAVEAEDHYTTYPLVQVLSHYIHSSAPPPPDHLDDFNPDSQQQQQIYNPSPDIENNSPHFLDLSPSIPPSAPVHQDLGDLNPNNQQQHINFTPSDIENDVFDEDLPPNSILAQHENPVPPPPDYLE